MRKQGRTDSPRWGAFLHGENPGYTTRHVDREPLYDEDLPSTIGAEQAPDLEARQERQQRYRWDRSPERFEPEPGDNEFMSDRDRYGAARWEQEEWRGRGDFEDTDFRQQGKPWDWDNTGDSPAARFHEDQRFYAGVPGERERGGVDDPDDDRAPGRGDRAARGMRNRWGRRS